jgi:hypothetical protein
VVGPHPIGPEALKADQQAGVGVEGKARQALELEHACLDHKGIGVTLAERRGEARLADILRSCRIKRREWWKQSQKRSQ